MPSESALSALLSAIQQGASVGLGPLIQFSQSVFIKLHNFASSTTLYSFVMVAAALVNLTDHLIHMPTRTDGFPVEMEYHSNTLHFLTFIYIFFSINPATFLLTCHNLSILYSIYIYHS